MPPVFTPTSHTAFQFNCCQFFLYTTTHLHATRLHTHLTHRVLIQLLPHYINHHPPSCHPSSPPPQYTAFPFNCCHIISTTTHLHATRLHPHLIHRVPIQLLPHYINHHPPSCRPSSPPPHTPRSHSVAATLYQPPPTFMPPVFTSTSYTAFPFSCCSSNLLRAFSFRHCLRYQN